MVLHHNAFHEVLVDHFAVPLPHLAVVCDQDVVAPGDEVVRYIAVRAVAVDAGFLVEQLLDQSPVCQYYSRAGAQFE